MLAGHLLLGLLGSNFLLASFLSYLKRVLEFVMIVGCLSCVCFFDYSSIFHCFVLALDRVFFFVFLIFLMCKWISLERKNTILGMVSNF